MTNQKSNYRQILKATSLFGGVQVVSIIIGIVRTKIVAILLGTTGIGLLGLFQVSMQVIQSTTSLGLSTSAVRNISEANESANKQRIASTVITFRRWVWATGLLGMFLTLFLAPLLSKWTFGNESYTSSFICLSVICLLSALSSGQNVLLQGMRRLEMRAKSIVYGTLLGLFTSIPLYYFFGLKGIVPSLIILAFSALCISFYFAKKIKIQLITQSWTESYHSGLGMAKLGIALMLSGVISSLTSYLLNLYISHQSGVEMVGLYRAGWTMTTQYTALILTAMASDYYPRLAGIQTNTIKLNEAVNQQAEIAILLLGPMLVAFIGFVPFVVHLFYSAQFMPIAGLVKLSLLGMLFKAASWALAYCIIAKGDNKLFFFTETFGNVVVICLAIIGYRYWGLDGIGLATSVGYIFYFIVLYLILRQRYSLLFLNIFWKIFVVQFLFVLAAFAFSFLKIHLFNYFIISILFLGVCIFSFYELNKRLDFKTLIARFRKRQSL